MPSRSTSMDNSLSPTVTVSYSRFKDLDYKHAACSSEAALVMYLSKIFSIYECAVSIFEGFTPINFLNLLLANKNMAAIFSRDKELIDILVNKHFYIRRAPNMLTQCEWCSQVGCECAGCYQWDHRSQAELNDQSPRLSNPAKRLFRFCGTCIEGVADIAFKGRCVCNTKRMRSMCGECKPKEMERMILIGYSSWYKPIKFRSSLSEKEMKRLQKHTSCSGRAPDGFRCENLVGSVSKGAIIGADGKRIVNVCSWCGLAAVDVPPRVRVVRCKGPKPSQQ